MSRLTKISGALLTGLTGKVSVGGEARYDAACAIWPKSEAAPAFIVHCNSPTDVQHAIRAARQAGLPLSVRGGGHDWLGRALCNGIVLDLTPMRDIRFSSNDSVWVGGGARGVDLFEYTDPSGLAAVTGSVGVVGLAGLTLGGGYGPLLSQFGLASDNLLGAEIVLADGSITTTEAEGGDELLWALRGGGGNFGVVTSLRLKLHDLPSVRSGIIIYPVAEAAAVLDGVADMLDAAPDALDLQVGIIPGPEGAFCAAVAPTWSGPREEGEAWIAPLLKLGTPLIAHVRESSYGDSRSVFDQYAVNGRRTVMQTRSLPRLQGDAVRIAIEQMRKAPSPLCSVLTHDFRGAATRIAPDASAFGLRQKHVMVEILAQVADRASNGAAERAWALDTAAAFDALALPGGYANFLGPDDQDRADKSYGGNADRLRAVKRRFDPDGIFNSAIPLPR
ncbi:MULTISPECIES: FAD-binding oxidoreductase [unclassified Sinorhizobium]|uniref:FAD-binding oxidoreductase n=1 Tax=unclassified Sinorhizobium TaxID=2613772 RepID=UPI003526C00B